jgi:hypothetical protein
MGVIIQNLRNVFIENIVFTGLIYLTFYNLVGEAQIIDDYLSFMFHDEAQAITLEGSAPEVLGIPPTIPSWAHLLLVPLLFAALLFLYRRYWELHFSVAYLNPSRSIYVILGIFTLVLLSHALMVFIGVSNSGNVNKQVGVLFCVVSGWSYTHLFVALQLTFEEYSCRKSSLHFNG